ncbi:wax ester/triacylglycerol synthase family O-acyltransferase [Nocardia cyriacigeorgica]|uniref:Diacylglycerol O-acyltransferase n=2 Tax=Nocardia TaxID=1817 RepID=H6R989_NOCCG|nr:wax ester/triacylglycerol synthase family O-acyltransferase [Nocardia cyriacigeorgica]CCF63664.1 Diacylglycerol O-acyltransferase [Nocardia cyriacigeorgica GUH-2]
MTDLRPLDSGFMELEDADWRVSLGIGVVAIMAGSPPPRDQFFDALERQIREVPRLRQRVHRAPLDIATPAWEPDPNFDLGHHLRWAALPTPRDESALWELVAVELEERLDRDRPLWQCVVVEEVSDDRRALIVKAHHSLLDGVSGVAMFERLCEPVTEQTRPTVLRQQPQRTRPSLSAMLRLPAAIPGAVLTTIRNLAPVGAAVVKPGPGSSLNGPIGHQRRYTAVRVPLSTVSRISAAHAVTVNDVVLSAIAGGYRDVLLGRGEEPTVHLLRILVPVSMRAEHAKYVLDNRVSALLPYLPVHCPDPVERLRLVHETMQEHKSSGASSAERNVLSVARWLPFAPVAWTLRLVGKLPQRGVGAIATNVPGPRHALTLHGCRVLELLPAVPIAMRLRTAVAILSYADQLAVGITGDYDTTGDIDVLAAGIKRSIEELALR